MSESFFEKADDFVRATANNVTFGAADYIAGFGNKAIFGGTIKQNIEQQHEYSNVAAERSPNLTFAGKVAGNMLAAEALAVGLTGKGVQNSMIESPSGFLRGIGFLTLTAGVNELNKPDAAKNELKDHGILPPLDVQGD